MRKKRTLILFLILLLVLVGCKEVKEDKVEPIDKDEESFIENEVIANLVSANEKLDSYYVELAKLSFSDEFGVSEIYIKEWYKDGYRRTERIFKTEEGYLDENINIYNENNLLSYNKTNNTAYISENFTESDDIVGTSLKKQLVEQMKIIEEDNEIQELGFEEIDGVRMKHLQVTPKDKDNYIEKQELWIDEKDWVVRKQIDYTPDGNIETYIMVYEEGIDIKDDVFSERLPLNAQLINIDEDMMDYGELEDSDYEDNASFVELSYNELGNDILVIPKETGWILDTIISFEDELGTPIVQEYSKADNFISVEARKDLNIDELDRKDELSKLRNTEAIVYDSGNMKIIEFEENNVFYTIITMDGDLDMNQFKNIIEAMVYPE